ncbi:hypothetical protein NW752_009645 [Fusarium irregulare]|uniref:Uncharacterized protein n=1 Tax=Fusarium irregulare TaxID=2494466 RepID=A0A9W8U5M2_9HYPO|nr:hypothetical protein NW766_011422 [Fusarium irregulare]KAJ4009344.1 hypothetical protein NW752_009645 [Fusarium irregulare]
MPSESASASMDRAQIQELREALQRLNYQFQGIADHLREALDAIEDLHERVYTLEQQGPPSLAQDESSSASSSN